MLSVLSSRRKALKSFAITTAALFVAACQTASTGGSGPEYDPAKPVPVALLLPSGSPTPGDDLLARDLKQAADMAIADLSGAVKVDLRVYDVGADPATAATLAKKAVDDGAAVILGPVYGAAANAAGLAVKGSGVNVLSFSNNTDIAGGNVFVLGQTFQDTANRLTRYAASHGRSRMLIVEQNDAQGDLGRRSLEMAGAKNGVSVNGSVGYDFSGSGVATAVPNIVATAKSSGADMLMLTASSNGALPLLAQLMPEQGLPGSAIQYVGLTRWDMPPTTMSLPGLQGGWFAMPDPALNAQFQSRYMTAYGSAPNPIAGLAYDGIAAIGALIRSGRTDPFSASALTQSAGFVGVTGVFRLMPDGTNQRGLAVIQLQNGQPVTIDPAPRSFGGGGF